MQGTSKIFFLQLSTRIAATFFNSFSPFRLSWWISQVADAFCYSHSLLCTRAAATLGYLLYYMYRYMLQFYTLAQSQKCF